MWQIRAASFTVKGSWGLGPHERAGRPFELFLLIKPVLVVEGTKEEKKKETGFYKLVEKCKAADLAIRSPLLALVAEATTQGQHQLALRLGGARS